MLDYVKCTEKTTDPLIAVKENKSRFIIDNKNRLEIEKIQVDGCLIEKQKTKCDWLFVIQKTKSTPACALYVELKGTDIKKATEQLTATLSDTKKRYQSIPRLCYVVSTRMPKHGPTAHRLKLEFEKKHNIELRIKTNTFTYKI